MQMKVYLCLSIVYSYDWEMYLHLGLPRFTNDKVDYKTNLYLPKLDKTQG